MRTVVYNNVLLKGANIISETANCALYKSLSSFSYTQNDRFTIHKCKVEVFVVHDRIPTLAVGVIYSRVYEMICERESISDRRS